MVTFVSMHLSSNRSNVRYNNNFSDNFILLVMVCITFSLSNSHVFSEEEVADEWYNNSILFCHHTS